MKRLIRKVVAKVAAAGVQALSEELAEKAEAIQQQRIESIELPAERVAGGWHKADEEMTWTEDEIKIVREVRKRRKEERGY